jgi:hypothetical protein
MKVIPDTLCPQYIGYLGFHYKWFLLLLNQQGHRVSCCQCIIHMTMSASRRINMLCIKFKNNVKRTLQQRYSVHLNVGCGILLTYGKHLHGRIISLRI